MSFYGQQRFVGPSESSARRLAPVALATSYEGLGATSAPVFNASVMRSAMNVALTPEARLQLSRALDQEAAMAAAMPETQFWGWDGVWLADGGASLRDARQAGAGGGGGHNMSWNNNQFWSLGLPCSVGLFASVMYQQRRYMAAQFRLAAHLRAAPDARILEGFDRAAANPTMAVREACGGATVRDNAEAWAHWTETALKLIGVARWASNFTWSRGSRSAAQTPYNATVEDMSLQGSADVGNRYAPDRPDAFGTPIVGYIAGTTLRGTQRFEALMSARCTGWLSRGGVTAVRGVSMTGAALSAASSWTIAPCEDRPSAGAPCTGSAFPEPVYRDLVVVAPRVLALHSSSIDSFVTVPKIPTDQGDFTPGIADRGGQFSMFPAFMSRPGDATPGSWLLAYFLERGAPDAQLALREQSGFWFWRYRDRGFNVTASGLARGFARAVPASELLIWQVLGWARDIIDKPFGQLVVEGFQNLAAATAAIPEPFRTQPIQNAASVMAELSRRSRDETVGTIGGAFAAVAGVASAINPIADIVVTLLGAVVSALASFASDVGIVRAVNPPALQFPAARVSPPELAGGDDRCWVNPDSAIESLSAYNERVAAPFATAAQRAGGNPAVMFELIPRVRDERAGRFDIVMDTSSSSTVPWGPIALAATFAALGVGTIVIARRRKKGRRS